MYQGTGRRIVSFIDRLGNQPEPVNMTVRYAAMFLMTFAIINVGRELTYLVGSVQATGAPTAANYQAVFYSLFSAAMGGLTRGLRNFSRKAWFLTIGGGLFLTYKIGKEFLAFLGAVLRGVPKTDFQLLLLGFALFMLVTSVCLLLSPQGREPFFQHETSP